MRLREEQRQVAPPLVRHFAELHADAILGLSPFLCTSATGHLRIAACCHTLLELDSSQVRILQEFLATLRVPVPRDHCLIERLFGTCEFIDNSENTAPVIYGVIVRHSMPSNPQIRLGTLCRLVGLCLVRAELPEPLLCRQALVHAVALGLVYPAPRVQPQHYYPYMGATAGPSGVFPAGRWDDLLQALTVARQLVSPPPAAVGFFLSSDAEFIGLVWTISSAKVTIVNTRHSHFCCAVTLCSRQLAFGWLAKCLRCHSCESLTFHSFLSTPGAQLLGSLIS